MALKKGDFIEIEFTGKTSDGDIFDSNINDDLKKANLNVEAKPFVFALGENMFLSGVDNYLIGKEVGQYKIELTSDNAFGKRNAQFIQRMPLSLFKEHKLNPIPGFMFNFDGRVGKVLAVSGGRVMVDFNNPLAGKDVIYDIKINRIVEDVNEKVKSFNEFLFKKNFDFVIENKKLILKVEKSIEKFVEMFKDKYKEVLGLDLEVQALENPKTESKQD